ncbi:MAG: SDR family oxidoreductase [Ktedonobacterales bacterium]|nr:SDR family oxidoreductase [Ktedonobacterales bacterium]
MTQQVAIITGASGGIGAATARALAAEGAHVVLTARRGEVLHELTEALLAGGHEALAVAADVTDAAQVAEVVRQAQETFGHIDLLVNAAGVGILKPFLDLTEADLDQMLAVNCKGTFLMSQAVARVMAMQKRGTIINVVGVLGRAPMANSAGYAASKYAVNGLSKVLAQDLRRLGIRTTALYLGGVDSPFWDAIDMRVQRDKMLSVTDAANAVVYAATQPDALVLNELVLQPESHQLL